MKERFENDGRPNLVDALKRQEFVGGDAKLADALIKHGELMEYKKGDKLITEGGEDNDIYLLLAGSVAIVVKGNEIATRKAGQHVGEMAAIEPAQKRSATVVAHDTLVALKLKAPISAPSVRNIRRSGCRLSGSFPGVCYSATI